jgi:hypothetical protein
MIVPSDQTGCASGSVKPVIKDGCLPSAAVRGLISASVVTPFTMEHKSKLKNFIKSSP